MASAQATFRARIHQRNNPRPNHQKDTVCSRSRVVCMHLVCCLGTTSTLKRPQIQGNRLGTVVGQMLLFIP